jgi:hypothetical protein
MHQVGGGILVYYLDVGADCVHEQVFLDGAGDKWRRAVGITTLNAVAGANDL